MHKLVLPMKLLVTYFQCIMTSGYCRPQSPHVEFIRNSQRQQLISNHKYQVHPEARLHPCRYTTQHWITDTLMMRAHAQVLDMTHLLDFKLDHISLECKPMELFHQKGCTCFRCQPYNTTVAVCYSGHQYPSHTGSGVKSYHLQMRTVKDVNASVKLLLSRAQCLSTEHAYIALPQRQYMQTEAAFPSHLLYVC